MIVNGFALQGLLAVNKASSTAVYRVLARALARDGEIIIQLPIRDYLQLAERFAVRHFYDPSRVDSRGLVEGLQQRVRWLASRVHLQLLDRFRVSSIRTGITVEDDMVSSGVRVFRLV